MTNILSQIPKPKNQETSDAIQNLSKLMTRKSELKDIISRIEKYTTEQGGNLKNSPLYNIKFKQLKKIESYIKDIENIASTNEKISSELAGTKNSEEFDTEKTNEKSLDGVLSTSTNNHDLLGSKELKKLIDSLPGEYSQDESSNITVDKPESFKSQK
ncbi:MAG: hypothetical protein H7196_04665 [candidate division SR1 bacterium]|nr:hypothetical protein [candidate division SR1 bacterium]